MSTVEEDDGGPFFRVYALKAGDVLTEQDAADIQKVLEDFNEEISNAADTFHQGRMEALRDIGGDALVAAVEARDDATVKAAVDKALARFEAAKRSRDLGDAALQAFGIQKERADV